MRSKESRHTSKCLFQLFIKLFQVYLDKSILTTPPPLVSASSRHFSPLSMMCGPHTFLALQLRHWLKTCLSLHLLLLVLLTFAVQWLGASDPIERSRGIIWDTTRYWYKLMLVWIVCIPQLQMYISGPSLAGRWVNLWEAVPAHLQRWWYAGKHVQSTVTLIRKRKLYKAHVSPLSRPVAVFHSSRPWCLSICPDPIMSCLRKAYPFFSLATLRFSMRFHTSCNLWWRSYLLTLRSTAVITSRIWSSALERSLYSSVSSAQKHKWFCQILLTHVLGESAASGGQQMTDLLYTAGSSPEELGILLFFGLPARCILESLCVAPGN